MDDETRIKEPVISYDVITSLDQLDLSKRYSYADYFKWKFQERVELIKGFIHRMTPAPAPVHQKIAKKLVLRIGNFLEDKKCEMYFAPFDVRLPGFKKQLDDELVYTVVQPDLFVVCDTDKIDDRGCLGAPDLVVEILSPGNSNKEMDIKFDLYEENGVKEYWLVNSSEKVIFVYILEGDRFIGLKPFTEDDEISPKLFPELRFPVKGIFED